MPNEFCVCLCVGWVCAVLSVVGLGTLSCCVCVCLVRINSLYAQRGQPENSIVGFCRGQSAYIGQRPYNPVLQRAEEVVNDWE